MQKRNENAAAEIHSTAALIYIIIFYSTDSSFSPNASTQNTTGRTPSVQHTIVCPSFFVHGLLLEPDDIALTLL